MNMNNIDPTTVLIGTGAFIGTILFGNKLLSGLFYGTGFAIGCMGVYNYKDDITKYVTEQFKQEAPKTYMDSAYSKISDIVNNFKNK